jgi:hypothetical protein
LEDNPMGNFLMSKQSLNGAAFKLQTLINFHVGDTINSMTKASLFTGGADVLVYTTLMGGMGALLPFVSRLVPPTHLARAQRQPRFLDLTLASPRSIGRTWTSSRIWRCTCAASCLLCADGTT